ncbi:MAG TPA: hypothetical protein VIM42_00840 [Clostridium sp.]
MQKKYIKVWNNEEVYIDIINLNIQMTTEKESFLKDIDKFEITTVQEKLRNNVKGGKNE